MAVTLQPVLPPGQDIPRALAESENEGSGCVYGSFFSRVILVHKAMTPPGGKVVNPVPIHSRSLKENDK